MSLRQVPPVKPFFPKEDIEHVKSEVEKILKSGMLTLGEYTKRFETEYADLCGVRHAVAVNSGTSALEIALRSLGLREGENILVPTNTFSSTASVAFFAGGRPVLTDIDPETLCMDSENVQEYLNSRTKGVMVVHIGGLVCPDIKAIRELCEDHRLFLVEDAAHAQGSTIDGQHAGSLGDVGCFSFYPTKVMTTGEGGMITTDHDEIAQKTRVLRDQGKQDFHSGTIIELGYNWRLPEINAAIGLTQLKRLPDMIKDRNSIAQRYDKKLKALSGIEPLAKPANIVNNYYKYVAFLDPAINRDELKLKLREKGVRCGGEVYWPPLHLQPVYKRLLGTREGDFPAAEDVCRRMICLPMYPQMDIVDVEYVNDKLEETLSEI